MTLESWGEILKGLGVFGAVAMVLMAGAYTALKVLRSDKSIAGVIARIEQERDYYRTALDEARVDAASERKELMDKLDAHRNEASQERAALVRQIEDLRRDVQRYTLKPGEELT